MGFDQNNRFVPGLVTEYMDRDIRSINNGEVEDLEKAQMGLRFLNELTGVHIKPVVTMMNEGEIDLDGMNQAISRIYVGRRSMNPEGNLITADNWKAQLCRFADIMAGYLEIPERLDGVPAISVLSGGDFYGVKRQKRDLWDQKEWKTFNETADQYAASCRPTVREQVYYVGSTSGTLDETEERQRMVDDLNCMYDGHGQFDHQKLEEYIDACADWMVENTLKKGKEIQKLIPEFQDAQKVDALGRPVKYPQYNGDELNEAELQAIESYKDAGLYSMQESIVQSNLFFAIGQDMTENEGWKDYLASKGYPVTDRFDEVCLRNNPIHVINNLMLERIESRMGKLPEEEQYQMMLGLHCKQDGTGPVSFSDRQAELAKDCKERLKQETDEALQVIEKREAGRMTLTDPRREQDFISHMDNLVKLGEQFKLADHWYHSNSGAYDKLNEGLTALRDQWLNKEAEMRQKREKGEDPHLEFTDLKEFNQKIREVETLAETYLSDKGKARGTDLGKDRYAIAMNVLFELNPAKYRAQELKHNDYRETHHEVKRVSLQELQDRVAGHAQNNKKSLNKNVTGLKKAADAKAAKEQREAEERRAAQEQKRAAMRH